MARPHRRPARHDSLAPFRSSSQRLSRRLRCEPLEDRRLLAAITVDLADDLVDFNDGKTSLREAIFAANTVPGADEIRFDFGHDGPATLLLTQGELKIIDAVSIIGAGAGLLTIDGQLQSRLFSVGADAGDVTFRGMTLTRGQTTGDNTAPADALNQTYSGGAIRSSSAGLLTLDQVDVVSNATSGEKAAGGALYVTGPLAISHSKIRGNVAGGVDAEGGGLFATGEVTVAASTFSGNRGTRGGGVSSRGALTIAGSTFSGNRAVDWLNAAGGAIYSTGDLDLVNSTISTNAAQGVAASQGGGIWVDGAATLAHSTIIANTASTSALGGVGSGGGLYSDQSTGETLTISHTIIGGNLTTEENGELRLGTAALTLRYSLIADNDGTNIAEAPLGWADANGNLVGGVLYGYIDPLLDGLEENGGPTRTHALLPGSPAIFAGDPALVPGENGVPEFDQRGAPYARRTGTRVAIGAVESDVTPIIVDSLEDGSDGNYGPGELTLREALELANERVGLDAVEFKATLFAAGPQRIILTQGPLLISDEMELRGPGASLLTIDAVGNDIWPDRLGGGTSAFVIADANKSVAREVRIADLSVTGAEQAGIRSEESLTLIGVNVHHNWASFYSLSGGGIEAFELHLIASQVVDNTANSGVGGIYASGEVIIERSVVSRNGNLEPVPAASVGGVYVSRNLAGLPWSAYELTIINSDISHNAGVEAGGIRSDGFDVWVVNSTISENSSYRNGGALMRNIPYEYGIWNSSINNNSALNGVGGISLSRGSGTAVGIIEQTTISGNNGSGVVVSGAELTLRHSTVTDNAGVGVSITSSRTFFDHSLIAANKPLTGGDLGFNSGLLTVKHTIIGNSVDSALAEAPVGSPDINGNFIGGPIHGAIDALLAPLGDNGGPVLPDGARLLTHALRPGSPAIDGGDPTLTPGDDETPEFDQRGAPFARVAGRRIDIGAIERQEVGAALGADFNFDGVVDGADFLVWQRGFGATPGDFAAGDATGDGAVDGDDLGSWQQRYGDDGTTPEVAMGVATPASEQQMIEPPAVVSFDLAGGSPEWPLLARRENLFSMEDRLTKRSERSGEGERALLRKHGDLVAARPWVVVVEGIVNQRQPLEDETQQAAAVDAVDCMFENDLWLEFQSIQAF